MNITEFKQKVQTRILKEFLEEYRKPKRDWVNYSFLSILLIPLVVYKLMQFHALSGEPALVITILTCFLSSLFTIETLIHIKSFFNFKKYTDQYFGTITSEVPILENSEDLKKYFKEKSGQYMVNNMHNKFIFLLSEDEIEKLLILNDDEVRLFKELILDNAQKSLLVSHIRMGGSINLELLENLINILNKEVKDKLGPHLDMLRILGCSKELDEPFKHSLKHLL